MRHTHLLRHLLLPLVAAALLVAQAAGLHHRIEHGGPTAWAAHAEVAVSAAPHGFQPGGGDLLDPTHHCAAIDSHMLAYAPPVCVLPGDDAAVHFPPAAAVASHRWVAPCARPFDARAPPFRQT